MDFWEWPILIMGISGCRNGNGIGLHGLQPETSNERSGGSENDGIAGVGAMLRQKYTPHKNKNAPRSAGHFYWLTSDCGF